MAKRPSPNGANGRGAGGRFALAIVAGRETHMLGERPSYARCF